MTRVQQDVVPAIVDWLDGRGIGATVRTNLPEEWTADAGSLLIVGDDGGPTQWPIKSKLTIRLTAFANGRSEARRVATMAAGLLGLGRPPGVANISREMGGILDARDPTTGADLASVLLTVTARTVEI